MNILCSYRQLFVSAKTKKDEGKGLLSSSREIGSFATAAVGGEDYTARTWKETMLARTGEKWRTWIRICP